MEAPSLSVLSFFKSKKPTFPSATTNYSRVTASALLFRIGRSFVGSVHEIIKVFSIENSYVQVKADSSDLWFHYVLAYYSNSEKEKIGNLSKGDRITFAAECKGESRSGSTIIEVKYCIIN